MSNPRDPIGESSYQASHDELTGLLNRRSFERLVRLATAKAHLANERHAVCLLDLDRLGELNHVCGHALGDAYLRGVADTLQKALPNSMRLARIGGDEFGIVLGNCPLDRAASITENVIQVVADYQLVWQGACVSRTASAGLVEVLPNSESFEEVLRCADMAVFLAKREGGGRVRVYNARTVAVVAKPDEPRWLQRLFAALKDEQIELSTQPIVDVDGKDTVGPQLEVVLRPTDESGGAVGREELLRFSENSLLMPRLDRCVVRSALVALSLDSIELTLGRTLAIRLSGQSLDDPAFLDDVVAYFDATGVAPDRICFEVSPTSIIASIEQAQRFIGVMSGMGCQFMLRADGSPKSAALYDSTGLRFDFVRVDGAIIEGRVAQNPATVRARALVDRARAANIPVIVERGEVIAVAINCEVGGKQILHLLVQADGSIERRGDGTGSCADTTLYIGSTPEALLPGILASVDPLLFSLEGLTTVEPVSGSLCKVSVAFRRQRGGNSAFEIWYGAGSLKPSPAITEFVAAAIRQTDAWYARMQRQGRQS